ncbi:aspartate/glutamate racemase family protein [Salibacterium salarium]|uniref:Aspartate/glutamate racemase family protein n=1 Tax=Salibacterium salarium TaxID=284579 RepID=A0A3R9QIW1_9BACI|nr:aspartate/glutamate racemase family protein [Salibacterium salarium]RSL31431.1 aspartate/glutamate racemase family protein [Salibacterium salarium]
MIYRNQTKDPNTVGILLLDSTVPFIPGDMGNADTFSFPVKYKKVEGLTLTKMYEDQMAVLPQLVMAGQQLIEQGDVKAITGNCGYLLLYQEELVKQLQVPVFMSSLLLLPFLEKMIDPTQHKIGIITAESYRLEPSLLQAVDTNLQNVHIKGLEDKTHFTEVAIEETGMLDSQILEREVLEGVEELLHEHPGISILLLECSLLSPYSKAIQEKVKLPVFDYVSMINFVHDALA